MRRLKGLPKRFARQSFLGRGGATKLNLQRRLHRCMECGVCTDEGRTTGSTLYGKGIKKAHSSINCALFSGDLAGNRTRDCAVRGRRLNRLTTRPYFVCGELSKLTGLFYRGSLQNSPAFLLERFSMSARRFAFLSRDYLVIIAYNSRSCNRFCMRFCKNFFRK